MITSRCIALQSRQSAARASRKRELSTRFRIFRRTYLRGFNGARGPLGVVNPFGAATHRDAVSTARNAAIGNNVAALSMAGFYRSALFKRKRTGEFATGALRLSLFIE